VAQGFVDALLGVDELVDNVGRQLVHEVRARCLQGGHDFLHDFCAVLFVLGHVVEEVGGRDIAGLVSSQEQSSDVIRNLQVVALKQFFGQQHVEDVVVVLRVLASLAPNLNKLHDGVHQCRIVSAVASVTGTCNTVRQQSWEQNVKGILDAFCEVILHESVDSLANVDVFKIPVILLPVNGPL